MIKRTFLNNNAAGNLPEIGLNALESVREDLLFWEQNGTDLECYEDQNRDPDSEIVARFADLGDFHEYGLSFDFVPADSDFEGFYRYQLSCGGPSTEIRFFENHTEFVYLDWFCGVGFDVTNESGFDWVRDWFQGCDKLRFQDQYPEDLYSAYHSGESDDSESDD